MCGVVSVMLSPCCQLLGGLEAASCVLACKLGLEWSHSQAGQASACVLVTRRAAGLWQNLEGLLPDFATLSGGDLAVNLTNLA